MHISFLKKKKIYIKKLSIHNLVIDHFINFFILNNKNVTTLVSFIERKKERRKSVGLRFIKINYRLFVIYVVCSCTIFFFFSGILVILEKHYGNISFFMKKKNCFIYNLSIKF